MHLRKPVILGAWVLVALNLALALGGIALLVRMSPAIAVIIDRNDRSLAAGEQMLAALARDPTTAAAQASFDEAFAIAAGNITEAEEQAALDRLRDLRPALGAGEQTARAEAVTSIEQLLAINREAMREADLAAQRLGTAGAWGVAFMGLLSFAAGLIFIRRLNEQLLLPLQDLVDVVAANRSGDKHRRCPAETVRGDFRLLYDEFNGLLDESRWNERLVEGQLQIGSGSKE